MVQPKTFLTPHFETPEDIATNRGEDTSGRSSTIVQTLTPIGRTIAEISVPPPKQLQQMTHPTNRILALRLLDKNARYF